MRTVVSTDEPLEQNPAKSCSPTILSASLSTVFQLQRGAARGERVLDARTCQLGPADTVGVGDGGVLTRDVDGLASLDRGAKRIHGPFARAFLQRHDDETAWVAGRLVGEGIGRDHPRPFAGAADQEVRDEAEAFGRRPLQQPFELAAAGSVAVKDEVPRVHKRSWLGKAEIGEHGAQIGHGDFLVPADVDGAQERDLNRHASSMGERAAPVQTSPP